jgi:hypothetical protein
VFADLICTDIYAWYCTYAKLPATSATISVFSLNLGRGLITMVVKILPAVASAGYFILGQGSWVFFLP